MKSFTKCNFEHEDHQVVEISAGSLVYILNEGFTLWNDNEILKLLTM